MSNEKITERFKDLACSEQEKEVLQAYLFSCLGGGKTHRLKRNRVMIMEEKNKNKFIILQLVRTADENKICYACPKCFPVNYAEFLSSTIAADKFKSCIHTKLCHIIWGDEYDLQIDIVDDDMEDDLVEIISEKPQYMAAVHPSQKSPKGPGVVIITSKMLKPKCLLCLGRDCCIHLKIHLKKYKEQTEEMSEMPNKRLKIDKVEPLRPHKKKIVDPGDFDPFQYEGPTCNVFKIEIDFIQSRDMKKQNREINNLLSFNENHLIAKYDPDEECDAHGNIFEEKENMLCCESSRIVIHHTKTVETGNMFVLYRRTVSQDNNFSCDCKRFYTGEDDRLLRVSSAKYRISERERVLHFVSYEFYFNFLAQLLTGGETMNSYIKSQKFMNELFFGCERSPEHKKILHKGFEIFCHALRLPEDSNYCYKCPQVLEEAEKEDDFTDNIEYSIVDGLQMGCRMNNNKSNINEDYFKEEVVENIVVKGVEAKDRTFINSQKVRSIIESLLFKPEDPAALGNTVDTLNKMELDLNARSVLEMLNRISAQYKHLPPGYTLFLHELQLVTPISALMLPYSSNRALYEKLMNYLNNKMDIFSSAEILEEFIDNFPIITECIKNILEADNSQLNHFLPLDVSCILKNMIKLRFKFDKQSRQVAAQRTKPNIGFAEPVADFFPNYPIHTMENLYKADSKLDDSGDDDCEKNFSGASSISGGIGTLSCNHKITKGFRAIKKGESPVIFCHSILRRLPEKVKAHKRVVVYDFACKMHTVCLRRYPYRIRRFQFVIDRHHQTNHKACSQAYNISKYPKMNEVNTQIAEQLNNTLRKLATVVAYSNFQTYLRIIQIFISVKKMLFNY